jgi:hypothetical protein
MTFLLSNPSLTNRYLLTAPPHLIFLTNFLMDMTTKNVAAAVSIKALGHK